MAPKLVQATVSPSGTLTKTAPSATHTVFSPSVDAELTSMLEQVVNQGTGTSAAVPGYTVAGKTGTAQIPTPGHDSYVTGAYMASFVGFAPAANPTLSMIVVLDRPTPIFGGTVAAPVFSQIMSYALHRYDIPTTPGAHTTPRPRPGSHRPGDRTRPRTSRELRSHTRCGRDAGVSEACNAVGSTMRTVPMNLLFDDIEVIESVGDPSAVEVGGITHDSRRVVPGDLFCCVPGQVSDGHVHAAEAVERGAVGLLCEHFIPELLDQDVVQTRVAPGTMRPVMARLAAAFYGYPARDLLMIGVTGTNGKTTVTQLLGDLLGATGRPTNVMGTLSGARTTPEATEVQRVLAGVRDRQKSDGAATPWPWRCRATRWSSRGSRASTSTWPSSPTSATTTSTTTGRWRSTSRPRRRSSPRATRCAAWSTPTTRGAGGCSSDRASRRSRCTTRRHRRRAAARAHRVHLAGPADHDAADRCHQRRQRPAGGRGGAGPRASWHLGPEEIARGHGHVAPVPGGCR